jgi:hypothetical protein
MNPDRSPGASTTLPRNELHEPADDPGVSPIQAMRLVGTLADHDLRSHYGGDVLHLVRLLPAAGRLAAGAR